MYYKLMFTVLYINKFGMTCAPEKACLRRTIIFRTKWCSLFLHKFLRSDEEELHDHPFNYLSFILKGNYIEEIFQPLGVGKTFVKRSRWSIAFRDAFTFHRILVQDNQPTTLCFTWAAGKNWHYLVQGRKVKWRKYLGK